MSDAGEFLKSREASLASSHGPLAPDTVEAIGRRAQSLQRRDSALTVAAALVGAAAVGVGTFVALDLSAPAEPLTPAPTYSLPVVPSPDPVAPVPAPGLLDGFAPVPQLPADQIPWNEVGAGWFAVGYYDAVDFPHLEIQESATLPQRQGGISLISPDGTWYAAHDITDFGPGNPLLWDGYGMFMGTRVEAGDDTWYYDLSVYDFRSGELKVQDKEVPWELGVGLGNGRALNFWWNAQGPTNGIAGSSPEGVGGCFEADARGSSAWKATDMSHVYQPEAFSNLVCFGPSQSDPSKTSIHVVRTDWVADSRVVDELPLPYERYAFVGWVDVTTFLFAQIAQGSPNAEQIFMYDIRERELQQLDLTLYEDVKSSSGQGFFDRTAQRHVISHAQYDENTQWQVALYELDGTFVNEIKGECIGGAGLGEEVQVKVSGDRLIIFCENPGYIQMYYLTSGAPIGQWQIGAGREVRIDGHPTR